MIGSARFQRAVRGIPAANSSRLHLAGCRTLQARCVRSRFCCDRDDEGITIHRVTRCIVTPLRRIHALTIPRFNDSTGRDQ